jgi:hypothetical protein
MSLFYKWEAKILKNIWKISCGAKGTQKRTGGGGEGESFHKYNLLTQALAISCFSVATQLNLYKSIHEISQFSWEFSTHKTLHCGLIWALGTHLNFFFGNHEALCSYNQESGTVLVQSQTSRKN